MDVAAGGRAQHDRRGGPRAAWRRWPRGLCSGPAGARGSHPLSLSPLLFYTGGRGGLASLAHIVHLLPGHQMKNAAWESCPQHWRPLPTLHHSCTAWFAHHVATPPLSVGHVVVSSIWPAHSWPRRGKQDVWRASDRLGPQGRLSQPRPCIHTGQSRGIGPPCSSWETATRDANVGTHDQTGLGCARAPTCARARALPRAPRQPSHLAPQAAAGQGNHQESSLPFLIARLAAFPGTHPGGPLVVVVVVVAAPGSLRKLQL